MIEWKRTRIGAEELRYDFTAYSGQPMVGRISRYDGGPNEGWWSWTFLVVPPGNFRSLHDCSGVAETKQQAVNKVTDLVRIWKTEFPSTP